MTRQWLADPEQMCQNHLLGEHFETHIFIEKMQRGTSLQGFYESGLFFGARYVLARHNLLASKIKGHATLLVVTREIEETYPLIVPTADDVLSSITDLISRCVPCRKKHFG